MHRVWHRCEWLGDGGGIFLASAPRLPPSQLQGALALHGLGRGKMTFVVKLHSAPSFVEHPDGVLLLLLQWPRDTKVSILRGATDVSERFFDTVRDGDTADEEMGHSTAAKEHAAMAMSAAKGQEYLSLARRYEPGPHAAHSRTVHFRSVHC